MARILVVEDSEFTRRMILRFITAGGYEVIEACDGREGIRKAQTCKPDCVLLDLLMPDVDGFAVLEAIKKKGLNIPAIVLSADIQATSRDRCFELGAVDFVKKPANEKSILKAVRNALKTKVGI